jgi:hypothetical protein
MLRLPNSYQKISQSLFSPHNNSNLSQKKSPSFPPPPFLYSDSNPNSCFYLGFPPFFPFDFPHFLFSLIRLYISFLFLFLFFSKIQGHVRSFYLFIYLPPLFYYLFISPFFILFVYIFYFYFPFHMLNFIGL